MQVAIYDTVHLDWIIPYAELLGEEEMSVDFITSSFFKDDLNDVLSRKNPNFSWHLINPNSAFITFFKKINAVFKSKPYDLIILNSVDSRLLILFLLLILNRPKKILINLHDINNFFKMKRTIDARTNIRAIGKRALMILADGYIVNAESMKQYMEKNKLTRKPVYWLQPVYYKPLFSAVKTRAYPTIVVPGSIDQRRRDYHLVLAVIQELLSRSIQLQWILAGSPVDEYGFDVITKAKVLNTQGARISFYDKVIPEEEFQEIIAGATLILSPLVSSSSIHDDIIEVYGETKGSGNVYDAIRHSKPLIVPGTLAVPKEIVTSCIRYKSKEDLAEQLVNILTNVNMLTWYEQEAEKNSLYSSKEKIKSMFVTAFRKATSGIAF